MRFVVSEIIIIGKLVLAFRCLCAMCLCSMPGLVTCYIYSTHAVGMYTCNKGRPSCALWMKHNKAFFSRLQWLAAFCRACRRSLASKWHLHSVLIVRQPMTAQIGEGRSPAATGCDLLHVPWDSFPCSFVHFFVVVVVLCACVFLFLFHFIFT